MYYYSFGGSPNSGSPYMIPALLPEDSTEREFLKLPEDAQQMILRQGPDTEKEFRRKIEEFREKE